LRQFAEGHNLFLLAVVGLIPFALLSVILLVNRPSSIRIASGVYCIGGLIGILAFMNPSHVAIWYPLYVAATCHPRR